MPDRVRQVKAEALRSIEGVNTVLRVLVREQTETALEPARQALDGSGIPYTVHTGTGDKAEQYERWEALGREVIRQTG